MEELEAGPDVTGISVYILRAPYDPNPILEYEFRDGHGDLQMRGIVISVSAETGQAMYAGDFDVLAPNPIRGLAVPLSVECKAHGGYLDQVLFTDGAQLVTRWQRPVSNNGEPF